MRREEHRVCFFETTYRYSFYDGRYDFWRDFDQNYTGLPGGKYLVNVTDQTGCTIQTYFDVFIPESISPPISHFALSKLTLYTKDFRWAIIDGDYPSCLPGQGNSSNGYVTINITR